MPHPSRDIVICNAAAITTDTAYYINVPMWATGFIGYCTTASSSGTSPTLNVEISQGVKTATTSDTIGRDAIAAIDYTSNYTWVGYGQLTQITGNGTRIFGAVCSGNYEAASGLPNAGSWRNGPIG